MPRRRACPGQKGRPATGPNPADRGEPGRKPPPRHRRVRHIARLRPECGQAIRQRDDGDDPRCHPVSAGRSKRAAATPPGDIARRQSLQCQAPPPGGPGGGPCRASRVRASRAARHAVVTVGAWCAPMPGSTASASFASATSDARNRRIAKRWPRGLYRPRSHSQTDQTALLGALSWPAWPIPPEIRRCRNSPTSA